MAAGPRRVVDHGLAARALAVGVGTLVAEVVARRHEAALDIVEPVSDAGSAGRWSAVDVVVPARDEARTIAACVRSLTSPGGEVRVTVVDDSSTDGTGAIATRAGAHVVRLDGDPPPGWTGKTWAMVQARAGRGVSPEAPWLAFVDADVEMAPGGVIALVRRAEAEGLDAISPLLRQRCGSPAEALVVPLAYWQWMVGMGGGGRADARHPRRAVLNGQCLVVRRTAYDACGGHTHPSVRGTPVEDAALARLLARSGARVALVRGHRLGSVRMYRSAGAVRRGFVKNAGELITADWRRGAAVAAAGALLAQAPAVLVQAARRRDREAIAAVVMAWLVPGALLAPRYRGCGVPGGLALAVPVASLTLQCIAMESLVRHAVRRPTSWKGRRRPGTGG